MLHRLAGFLREIGTGIDTGHAIRLGLSAPERPERARHIPHRAADAPQPEASPFLPGHAWWTGTGPPS